jgi:hypothetical protein
VLTFQVKIKAVGEVRDKDGNLISSEPVEFDAVEMTEAQLIELDLPVPVSKEK